MNQVFLHFSLIAILFFSGHAFAVSKFSDAPDGTFHIVSDGEMFRGFRGGAVIETGLHPLFPGECLSGKIHVTPLDEAGKPMEYYRESLHASGQTRDGGECVTHYKDYDSSFTGPVLGVKYRLQWYAQKGEEQYGLISEVVLMLEQELQMTYNRVEGPMLGIAYVSTMLNMAIVDVLSSEQCVGKAEKWPSGQFVGEIRGQIDSYGNCSLVIFPEDLGNQPGTVKINVQGADTDQWFFAMYIDLHPVVHPPLLQPEQLAENSMQQEITFSL